MASLMIQTAGPYRSGTNDDPVLIEANVHHMTETALGDEIWNELFHSVAIRLIQHCDAVLRIGGPSSGADQMVGMGKTYGKSIFYDINEIPAPDDHE